MPASYWFGDKERSAVKRIFLVVGFILGMLVLTLNVHAQQNTQSLGDFKIKDMVLLGTALKRFLAFRVVTVDLYIAKEFEQQDVLSDIPKRLEVNYHVNIPKHELDRATIKGIEKNFSLQQVQRLMPGINQINSYYPDIKAGDQIAVTYIPQQGSQVELNGQIQGIVPGADFANAFFSIWVGENPVDEQAKLKLLGQYSQRKRKE